MSNSISTPFPFFAGLDGKALVNGKIYIGVDGLDARTNPKNTFFDRALTEPAAQPVRTISGYAANGVSAAQLFTSGAYSISVYTSSDVLVFSSLSESGDIAALQADIDANTAAIAVNAAAIAGLGDAAALDVSANTDFTLNTADLATRGTIASFVGDRAIINRTARHTLPITAGAIVGSSVSADPFTPLFYQCFLECLTADLGYSVGNIVGINNHLQTAGTSSFGQYVDMLNGVGIDVYFGSSAGVYQVLNKSTATVATITPARWQLIVDVYGRDT